MRIFILIAVFSAAGCVAANNGAAPNIATVQSTTNAEDIQAHIVWRASVPSQFLGKIRDAALAEDREEVLLVTLDSKVLTGPKTAASGKRFAPIGWAESLLDSDESGATEFAISSDAKVRGFRFHRGFIMSVVLAPKDPRSDAPTRIDSPDEAIFFDVRLAPRGGGFVGVDAAGAHLPSHADAFTYFLFDADGKGTARIRSDTPRLSDAAYSADGASFITNNGFGLAAFNVDDGTRSWSVEIDARVFDAANAQTGRVVAQSKSDRTRVSSFEFGELVSTHLFPRNISEISISPNGGYVFAHDGVDIYWAVFGEPFQRIPIENIPLNSIRSIAASDNAIVLVGARRVDGNGYVAAVDPRRGVFFATDLSIARANAWVPQVQWARDGDFAILRTQEEIVLLRFAPEAQ